VVVLGQEMASSWVTPGNASAVQVLPASVVASTSPVPARAFVPDA
jgi:hypothetical protein